MNKRQVDLLKSLIIAKDYLPIKYFSNELNISDKTLSKDLDKIESMINQIGASIDRKRGLGIKLYYTSSQLDILNSRLNHMKVSIGDDDLIHRRIQILLNLLINTDKYTTIQKLSDKYIVSRTSINNDLNEIEERIKKFNLKLSKTLKGTRINGSEINIRKALVSTIQEYAKINPNYITEYQNMRHEELDINQINTILNSQTTLFFEKLLNDIETKLKLVIYDPYYTNLLTHLLIMTNRIIRGNNLASNTENNDLVVVMNQDLYDIANYMIRKIENKFEIKIDKEEVVYIYKYLTSIGLSYEDMELKDTKEIHMPHVHFTKELIDTVTEMSHINYNIRINLYERLLLHIKPMLNRVKYNIQIKNPLLKDFLKEFTEEFFVIKTACFLVCNKFDLNMINDDEVSYILSYFISEDEKISETIKINTIVVCHSGYGTSQLLSTRLEKAFNNINVVDVIASNSIVNMDLSDIDLIVTTVDLNIERSYLMVSAFLNEIDKKNIKNHIYNILEDKRKSFSDQNIEDIKIENIKDEKSINIDDLIDIKDNIYISISNSSKNSSIQYIEEKGKSGKRIFIINYSNYKYLSKAIRKVIREYLKENDENGR
ncbi:BglG family transcription antiterminator [Senegalia sp. (in: firmicutes)]|uniref:BglG family transcription antiterminator n=1 Tax=Senegalia sp. (in: firmicutes) TaxID=1924098 RepID=UPI003F9BBEDF